MKLTLSPAAPGLDVSFVVGTYNHVQMTMQMIASLGRSMHGLKYEVIVVDNGSTDGTVAFLGLHTPGQRKSHAQGDTPPLRVTLLHNPVPRTLAASWNMGIEAAKGRSIIVTNNDVIYTPGAVKRLIEAADSQWQAGVVFPYGPGDGFGIKPKIVPPDTPKAIVQNLLGVEAWSEARTKRGGLPIYEWEPNAYVPQGGFCFLVTRPCLERVGGLDPDFELTGEDYSFFRDVQRHFKMIRVPGAYVEHYGHMSCDLLGREYNERMCRNRFLLAEKQDYQKEYFSVIIPTFQRIDALEHAIDSVQAQRFPHWKLYVVDDGSQDWDKISVMLRKYDTDRGRIWYFHEPKNLGPGAARNYGISQSRGKYVAFLDSDDIWYPDHLERHWQAHETGGHALIYSDPDFAWRSWEPGMNRYTHRKDKHPLIKHFGDFDPALLVKENFIQTSSVTVWGDLARSIPWLDRKVITNDVAEDWEWFKSVADVGGDGRSVLHLPGATCRYHMGRDKHEEDHLVKRVTGEFVEPTRDVEVMQSLPLAEDGLIEDEWVTVIIPTKERPDKLRRAIASCQGFKVVVSDDGSFYASSAFDEVDRANKSGGRAALIRSEKCRGASWARNRAAEYSASPWLQFLDDDDTLVPGWYNALLPYLADGTDAVVSCAYVPNEDRSGLRIDEEVFTSQVCVRRSAFFDSGMFDESVSWAEERDLLARMTAMGLKVVHCPVVVCVRASRGGSGNIETAKVIADAPTLDGNVFNPFGLSANRGFTA